MTSAERQLRRVLRKPPVRVAQGPETVRQRLVRQGIALHGWLKPKAWTGFLVCGWMLGLMLARDWLRDHFGLPSEILGLCALLPLAVYLSVAFFVVAFAHRPFEYEWLELTFGNQARMKAWQALAVEHPHLAADVGCWLSSLRTRGEADRLDNAITLWKAHAMPDTKHDLVREAWEQQTADGPARRAYEEELLRAASAPSPAAGSNVVVMGTKASRQRI